MVFPELFALSSADDAAPTTLAIHHPTLASVVADRLRQLIIDGTLKPGASLNERDLCDHLNVSRTPLREAYRILAADGLVEIQPKRGALVVELSREDATHIFDMLSVLEGLAIRQATLHASDTDLAQIDALHQQMLAGYRQGDIKAYFAASMGTHIAINRLARNPPLTTTYDRLNLRVQALRYKSNLDPDEWADGVADHERFVAAILARDAAGAEQAMREHLLNKQRFHLAKGFAAAQA